MIVSRKMIEAFVEFIDKANAGTWDDEVVKMTPDEWDRMGEILNNRRGGGYDDFLNDLEYRARHSTTLEIKKE